MDAFNQPAGDAREIVRLWGEIFATQPGHWGGTVLQTDPMITRIEFLDEARTKANVLVTLGYSGATLRGGEDECSSVPADPAGARRGR